MKNMVMMDSIVGRNWTLTFLAGTLLWTTCCLAASMQCHFNSKGENIILKDVFHSTNVFRLKIPILFRVYLVKQKRFGDLSKLIHCTFRPE